MEQDVKIMPQSKQNKVSIVIPCYNEEQVLPAMYQRLKALMDAHTEYQWEVIFIDDGSQDATIEHIKRFHQDDPRICFIALSRNFGKENAMLAGFDHATGDCIAIIDADLQDPPEMIIEMLGYWHEGYEDVYARRATRGKEPWLRKKFSLMYYSLLQRTTQVDVLPNVGDFRLLDRKCINALRQLRENERYTKGMFCWIGFKKKEVLMDRDDRASGTSSFNFFKLFNLAIEGITSYTTFPLRIVTLLGLLSSAIAILLTAVYFTKALLFGDPVQGFPTLIVAILLIGGVQLLGMGIMGEYISRIFIETKRRPVYLISEKGGLEDDKD